MRTDLFNKYLRPTMRRAGSEWSATYNGEAIYFYGVFDAENKLEVDGAGLNVLVAGCVLTCESRIAKNFTYNQQLTDDCGDIWYAREVMKVNDGEYSRVTLVEKP